MCHQPHRNLQITVEVRVLGIGFDSIRESIPARPAQVEGLVTCCLSLASLSRLSLSPLYLASLYPLYLVSLSPLSLASLCLSSDQMSGSTSPGLTDSSQVDTLGLWQKFVEILQRWTVRRIWHT